MIAKLIRKDNGFYCSECRMRQIAFPLAYTCSFCNAEFSNYEDMLNELSFDLYKSAVLDEKAIDKWVELGGR